MTKIKDKLQDIADAVQDKLSGITKDPKLHEHLKDKDERIKALEGELKGMHEKYNAMEKAWRNLAKATVGEQEAEKMKKQI